MTEHARLRWRCRRGMLELDLLLERFLVAGYDALTAEQRATFEVLLALPDTDLFAYLLGYQQPPDQGWNDVIAKIRHATHAAT